MDATLFRFRELLDFVELKGDVKEGIEGRPGIPGRAGRAGRAGKAGIAGKAATTEAGSIDDAPLPGTSIMIAIESPIIVAPTITKGAYSFKSSEV